MFIPVRAQIVSLTITFTFVAAEIGALLVARVLNRVFETSVLRRSRNVFIYRHCRRLKLISAAILLSFIGLETFTSSLTSTAFRDVKVEENCLRMLLIDQNNSTSEEEELHADLISFKCLQVNGTLFQQLSGNVSLDSHRASCDTVTLFEFNRFDTASRPLSETRRRCKMQSIPEECPAEGASEQQVVEFEFCAHYLFEDGQLFLPTNLVLRESSDDSVELFPSRIYSNLTAEVISKIVDKVVDEMMKSNIQDEVHFRRKSFTRIVRTRCDFTQSTAEGTDVPSFVLATVIGVWAVFTIAPLIMFIASRKWALIDLSDPVWWARSGEIPKGTSKRKLNVGIVDSVPRVNWSDSAAESV